MQVLRNVWTKEQQTDEVRNSYQYVVDLRGRIEKTLQIAHRNLREAQGRYRHHYDRRSRSRRLKVGDQVPVLLPTNQNKLLMQWKGPYPVTEVMGVNDYRVRMKGKVRNISYQFVEGVYCKERRNIRREETDDGTCWSSRTGI